MEIIDTFQRIYPDRQSFEDEYRDLVTSGSPCQSQMAQMMLDFVDRLRRGVVGPQLHADMCLDELSLEYVYGANNTTITAKVDYKDRSPVVNGIPILHYRLTYSLPENDADAPKVELRTHHVDEAYEFVLEAIKTCQRGYQLPGDTDNPLP